MNAVLKELHIKSDPTAGGPEDVETADGVTAQAVDKKVRDKVKAEGKAEDDSDAEWRSQNPLPTRFARPKQQQSCSELTGIRA